MTDQKKNVMFSHLNQKWYDAFFALISYSQLYTVNKQ